MDATKKRPSSGPPTQDQIRDLLDRSDAAVEEALLRLFARQTQDEQATRDTRHRNSRGFSAAHARLGSRYAGWIKGMREQGARSGTCLKRADHRAKARELVGHYVRQLHEEAVAKHNARVDARVTAEIASDPSVPPEFRAAAQEELAADSGEQDRREELFESAMEHGPVGDGTFCACGGEWLGDDCETRMVQAADREDARLAEEAKARRDDQAMRLHREEHGCLPPGTPARLTIAISGFPVLLQEEAGRVPLLEGAQCLVLRSELNRGGPLAPLYMTQALFGGRALWVPARSLRAR